ncbi:hypothetical protein ACFWIJ_29750, partial [Streptomyces sp. NPDC127079]
PPCHGNQFPLRARMTQWGGGGGGSRAPPARAARAAGPPPPRLARAVAACPVQAITADGLDGAAGGASDAAR